MGALLENYYAIGHSSADNYIAQVSGQAPDIATQSTARFWIPFPGQVIAGPYRQVLGEGCVYPAAVPTLGNQLSAAGRSWAAYLQDMGNDPGRDQTVATARGPACGHPATWAIDHTQKAEKGDQYAARHDGFTFCRRSPPTRPSAPRTSCRSGRCRATWPGPDTTPAFSFIAPDLCNDGHDSPCVTGAPGGLAASRRVPGPAGADDHGRASLPGRRPDRNHLRRGQRLGRLLRRDLRYQPVPPNVPLPGKTGPGGGRIGAVLLSPLIRPGTVSTVDSNHYSLLRTIEDIFGLPHLGDAAMPQVRSFGPDIFG